MFYTASVIWGVIGSNLQFQKGQTYHSLLYFLPIGAVCPPIIYFINRRWPNTFLAYANFPLMVAGLAAIPPATAVNFVPWAIVGFVFQFYVRRWHFSFWAKYNYILSAALDAGTACGIILVFFCLQYPLEGNLGIHTIQSWWGNTVFTQTADWNSLPWKKAETAFGAVVW